MPNGTEQRDNGPTLLLSARFRLALLSFFCCASVIQQRINLSVGIVCMVNHTALQQLETNDHHLRTAPLPSTLTAAPTCPKFSTTATGPREDGDLLWTKQEQGVVLSSLYWGFVSTQFLGGWLAERYGSKQVLFVSVLIGTAATFATPAAAEISYLVASLVRVIAGVAHGSVYAALLSQWGRWAPPTERSLLSAMNYGGQFTGMIVFFPVDAYICDAAGWPTVFYTSGAFSVLWCVLWQLFASSNPEESRWIGRAELRYIQRSLPPDQRHSGNRQRIPWSRILTSPVVWALLCLYFAECISYYFIVTMLPTYMHEVLHFDIKQNGLLSALPYVGSMCCLYATAFLADFVLRRQLATTNVVRKCCSIAALVGTGTTLVAAGYCDCRTKYLAVSFMIAAQAFNGLHAGGLIPATIDIAPQFGGTIGGICNTAGSLAGSLMPVITAAMTKHHTAVEWRSVFWLLFGSHIVAALIFLCFGEAKLQSWALIEADDSDENTDNQKQLDRETTSLM